MKMPLPNIPASTSRGSWMLLGAILTALGLLAHLMAARAIGGTHLAIHDHVLGFVLIAVVTGAIIVALGWRFWRGRFDITLLVFGAVQALMGLFVYVQRFNVHG